MIFQYFYTEIVLGTFHNTHTLNLKTPYGKNDLKKKVFQLETSNLGGMVTAMASVQR